MTFSDAKSVLLGPSKVGSEETINGTMEEVQQFILLGMHLPLVPQPGRVHREHADLPPIKFHWEEFNYRMNRLRFDFFHRERA